VPVRSVESVLLLPKSVPPEREKLGNGYRLQGFVKKSEAVLLTELSVAVDHG
jgi:hypothetical protein